MTKKIFRNSYSDTFKYKALIYAQKFKNIKEASIGMSVSEANLYAWYKKIATKINLNKYYNLEEALTPLIDKDDLSFENHLKKYEFKPSKIDADETVEPKKIQHETNKEKPQKRTDLSHVTQNDVDKFFKTINPETHPFYAFKWKTALYKLLKNNNIADISREFKISPITLSNMRRSLILFVKSQSDDVANSTPTILSPENQYNGPILICQQRSPDDFIDVIRTDVEESLKEKINIQPNSATLENALQHYGELKAQLKIIEEEQKFLYQRVVDIMTTMNTIATRQLETNEKLDKLGFLEKLK